MPQNIQTPVRCNKGLMESMSPEMSMKVLMFSKKMWILNVHFEWMAIVRLSSAQSTDSKMCLEILPL